jgi:hypothetical protein
MAGEISPIGAQRRAQPGCSYTLWSTLRDWARWHSLTLNVSLSYAKCLALGTVDDRDLRKVRRNDSC